MGAGCLCRSASALAYRPRPRSPQYAPFIDDGDDFLSQICQMQIFFSLLSTIILQTNPNSPVMAVLLPILITFPPISGFIFESGVLDELKKITSPDDNGWPIPFSGGKRIGIGLRSKSIMYLEVLLGVKKTLEELEEDRDVAEVTTKASFNHNDANLAAEKPVEALPAGPSPAASSVTELDAQANADSLSQLTA